jgi:hypothetical protein
LARRIKLETLGQIFLDYMYHKLKTKNVLPSKGKELYKYWINPKANPRCISTLADQHSCKLPGLQVKYILSYANLCYCFHKRKPNARLYYAEQYSLMTLCQILYELHVQQVENCKKILSQWQ